VLRSEEKAYCRALMALREKKYQRAEEAFAVAAEYFAANKEFVLLRETNLLLLEVRSQLGRPEPTESEMLEIQEAFTRG